MKNTLLLNCGTLMGKILKGRIWNDSMTCWRAKLKNGDTSSRATREQASKQRKFEIDVVMYANKLAATEEESSRLDAQVRDGGRTGTEEDLVRASE